MVQYLASVDRAFAALADPTRRAVLERLGAGSATISELAEPFGMSLTGMKKHVRLLEEAQLVTTEKVGRVRKCTLVPYAFEGISTWLQRQSSLLETLAPDACRLLPSEPTKGGPRRSSLGTGSGDRSRGFQGRPGRLEEGVSQSAETA
jgi:DNA-binding transcriptional ArsR family regulator